MSGARAALVRQFGRPTGVGGHLAGLVMAVRGSNRERNRWTVDQLDIQPTDHVLEIGFGPGLAIGHAARRASAGIVVGVDRSEVMLRQATWRHRAGIAGGRIALHLGDIDSPALDRCIFTKAMAVNVFVFWPDPADVLRRLANRLTPGARVALTLQPRGSHARNDDASAAGERMTAAFLAAGYTDVETRSLPLKPVNAVCALGRLRPSSQE